MDSTENNQQQNDFLMEWLPGCNDMLKKTLSNSDMLYYPPSDNNLQSFKVFDFTSQRNVGEEDDFVSIDTKSSSTAKTKGKNVKKTKDGYASQSKQKQQKAYVPPQPKFRISQSINSGSDWKLIADYNKLTLEKLQFDNSLLTEEDKFVLGSIYQLSDDYENKISAYNPMPLAEYENMKFFGNITTLEDEQIKSGSDIGNVFVTDKILSVIMTSNYVSHPWHLKITKLGDNIYFDKMENSEVDLVTVDESDGIPNDEEDRHINSYKSLGIEATLINEFIKEMIIDKESPKAEVHGPNPFMEETETNSVEHLGYKYRVWKMDGMDVVVRCQVHAYDYDENDEQEYINIYALNEYIGNTYLGNETNLFHSLIKKELIKNHLKLTKWGVNCYLAGVRKMLIGFVTRKSLKENTNHLVTGFYNMQSSDLLVITNFNRNIGWGILKEIVELIRKQKDGAFILLKTYGGTAAKSMIKLYSVPETVFATEVEEDDF